MIVLIKKYKNVLRDSILQWLELKDFVKLCSLNNCIKKVVLHDDKEDIIVNADKELYLNTVTQTPPHILFWLK
jgi:hypothetical protein